MDYRHPPRTDLRLSRLCLGTMTFGKQVNPADAGRMLDLCIDAGINFIDTANAYQAGGAESVLGSCCAAGATSWCWPARSAMKWATAPTMSASPGPRS